MSMCPQALQEEAGSFAPCPQCPTFTPLHPPPNSPVPGLLGLGPESFPSCQGPKHLAEESLLGEEQRRMVVLVLPYSHSSLGCSWFRRVRKAIPEPPR